MVQIESVTHTASEQMTSASVTHTASEQMTSAFKEQCRKWKGVGLVSLRRIFAAQKYAASVN